jgi:hypothetical protein
VLRRLKQEECEFQVSLGCTGREREREREREWKIILHKSKAMVKTITIKPIEIKKFTCGPRKILLCQSQDCGEVREGK